MVAPQHTGEASPTASAAEVRAIKDVLATHISALVAAAHSPEGGTFTAHVRADMTFIDAWVVPHTAPPVPARGAPGDYLVRLCPIVAWRPWVQRDIEAAIQQVDVASIDQCGSPAPV